MEQENYAALLENQKNYFKSGITLEYNFRKQQLEKLLQLVQRNEAVIAGALMSDLRKPTVESFTTEIGVVIGELRYHIRNLRKWMAPRPVRTPLLHFRAKSYTLPVPHGAILIISPWNYPFMLALRPVIGAIAAGNTIVLKPSETAPAVAQLLARLIGQHFDDHYFSVVLTDAIGSAALVQRPFDFVFFTGGSVVGKKIYAAAAAHLTPVVLELGGKNPCIIDREVDLDVVAARIVWGKFTNAGQTCVSPDFIYIHESLKNPFLEAVKKHLFSFYQDKPQLSDNYGRIINAQQWSRLKRLMEGCVIEHGGFLDESDLYIEPTIVTCSDRQADIWKEEIFGPVMLLATYTDLETILTEIKLMPTPLVVYLFSNNIALARRCMREIPSGDFVLNDVVVHFGHIFMPVGGKGNSGFGKYQGKATFEVFSHHKSILHKKLTPDIPLRYPPYSNRKVAGLKWVFQWFYSR